MWLLMLMRTRGGLQLKSVCVVDKKMGWALLGMIGMLLISSGTDQDDRQVAFLQSASVFYFLMKCFVLLKGPPFSARMPTLCNLWLSIL